MWRRSNILLAALAVIVAAAVGWKLVVHHDDRSTIAKAPPGWAADATKTVGARDWVRGLPEAMTDVRADDLSLSAAEVAPSRFTHQLRLVRREMRGGEKIGMVNVQPDGTLVVLAMTKRTSRWIATRRDLNPAPPPAPDELSSIAPLTSSDIDGRAPAKLRRVILRAGGIAPGRLTLRHATGGADPSRALYLPDFDYLFGDAPVWQIKWPKLVGTLLASGDAHTLKALG